MERKISSVIEITFANMRGRLIHKIHCGLLLVFTLNLICVGQSINSGKISSDTKTVKNSKELLSETIEVNAPGAAVLIARGNKILFRSARGMANIELGVPLSPDHVFNIASITKIFTAAQIIKMSEAGKLSLDDTLNKFLPDFPNAQTITIEQLLNHTAGVSDRVPKEFRQPGLSSLDLATTDLVAEIAKRPLNFLPGSNHSYSNAGYILLGAVIEKVTGKRWFEAMQENFFTPLGLKSTTYGIDSKILKNRVEGYTTATPDHSAENASFISLSTPAAAGGLVSTLDDLQLWMRFLADGKVLNKFNFEQMTAPTILPENKSAGYGFGIYIWSVRGEKMIGHTGQINGFASILAYIPKENVTIVALANDDNFDAQNFGRKLAAIVLGKPFTKVKSVPISETELRTIAGKYQDGKEIRSFFVKDGKLYSQREGRNPILMQITAEKQIHFVPAELSYFVPEKDSSGNVIRLDYYFQGESPPRQLLKID